MSSPTYRRAFSALCGILVVPVLIGTGCGPTVEEPPKIPDIVVVLIDTLRPDRLGLDDDLTANAPFLKRLARDSVVFRNAHSTSTWTAPATASLFTSLYPPQHGVVTGFNAHSRQIKKSGAAQIEINRLPDPGGLTYLRIPTLQRRPPTLPPPRAMVPVEWLGVGCVR